MLRTRIAQNQEEETKEQMPDPEENMEVEQENTTPDSEKIEEQHTEPQEPTALQELVQSDGVEEEYRIVEEISVVEGLIVDFLPVAALQEVRRFVAAVDSVGRGGIQIPVLLYAGIRVLPQNVGILKLGCPAVNAYQPEAGAQIENRADSGDIVYRLVVREALVCVFAQVVYRAVLVHQVDVAVPVYDDEALCLRDVADLRDGVVV